MKNRVTLSLSIIFFFFFLSCKKETHRIDNFFVEFATVNKSESILLFLLDDDTKLTPSNPSVLDLKDGMRALINYTPLENSLVKINSYRPIFMDSIRNEGYPDKVKTDPIKIISVWVSGNYLNISFEVDYHSKSHASALFRDTNAEKTTLYFSYSREDDPTGAPTLNYLSFNLNDLKKKSFVVYINTYKGKRKLVFEK
ncbi:MAG TPA: NigD-like C-terminal domain-containing protein [Dysgonamonadaceae bacterium]|nr:NigD-like C-terminal domain-containing protein [Dysgonamonadaceae bacterium]